MIATKQMDLRANIKKYFDESLPLKKSVILYIHKYSIKKYCLLLPLCAEYFMKKFFLLSDTYQYFFLFPAQKTSPAHSNNFLHHPAYLCHDTVPFVPHTKKHFYVFLSPAASAPQNLPLLPYHYSEAVHMVLLMLLFPH